MVKCCINYVEAFYSTISTTGIERQKWCRGFSCVSKHSFFTVGRCWYLYWNCNSETSVAKLPKSVLTL